MKRVSHRSTVLLVVVAVAGAATLIADERHREHVQEAAGGQVCALFPDPATSIRWVHYDAPALKAALKKARHDSSDLQRRRRRPEAEGAG